MFRMCFVLCLCTLCASCLNKFDSNSNSLGIVGDTKSPSWSYIKEDSEEFYGRNIFTLYADNTYIGTAFLIGPKSKYIFTNSHVATAIKNCSLLGIPCSNIHGRNPWAKIMLRDIAINDSRLDFAAIEFEIKEQKKNFQTMSINKDNGYKIEESMSVSSYTHSGRFIVSFGTITAIMESEKVRPRLEYTADTVPGMSGSPVFNDVGELIGIHFSSSEDKTCNKAIIMSSICQKYSDKMICL